MDRANFVDVPFSNIVKDKNTLFKQVSQNLWNNHSIASPKIHKQYHATNAIYDSKKNRNAYLF